MSPTPALVAFFAEHGEATAASAQRLDSWLRAWIPRCETKLQRGWYMVSYRSPPPALLLALGCASQAPASPTTPEPTPAEEPAPDATEAAQGEGFLARRARLRGRRSRT